MLDEKRLKAALEREYKRLNRREFVSPDPLQFLFAYDDVREREIVGLVASGLSFGNVKTIIGSIGKALSIIGSPFEFATGTSQDKTEKLFSGFAHRWVRGAHIAALLTGAREVIEKHGSLNACFLAHLDETDDSVLKAASAFASEICTGGGTLKNPLLPNPARGGACKRLHLYLRWMVRKDAVDPGGWTGVPKSKLVVPLDTHHFKVGKALGFTKSKLANAKTALEITQAYRRLSPDDPVKYDFALTRYGIRGEAGLDEFLRDCGAGGDFSVVS